MTKSLRMLVSAAAVLIAAPHALAQEKIELKASTYLPPTIWLVTNFLQPWGAEIAKRTGGRVTVRVFAANSPFGNIANQFDQVVAGVTDIALGQNGFPRGRRPRSLLMEMPLMAGDGESASKALWSMRDSHLAEDYKGVKLLALFCGQAVGYFTRDKKVDRLEDLKGLRIRVTSAQAQAVVQHFGGVPVTLGIPQVYESLEKGVLDGAILGYDGIISFKLGKLLRYYYPARMFVTCIHAVMNQQRYDTLPAEVKKAIDETTGDAMTVSGARMWTNAENVNKVLAQPEGIVEAAPVSAELHAKWRVQLKPVIDQQLAETEKQGVANARAIYEEMLKRAAQFAR